LRDLEVDTVREGADGDRPVPARRGRTRSSSGPTARRTVPRPSQLPG